MSHNPTSVAQKATFSVSSVEHYEPFPISVMATTPKLVSIALSCNPALHLLVLADSNSVQVRPNDSITIHSDSNVYLWSTADGSNIDVLQPFETPQFDTIPMGVTSRYGDCGGTGHGRPFTIEEVATGNDSLPFDDDNSADQIIAQDVLGAEAEQKAAPSFSNEDKLVATKLEQRDLLFKALGGIKGFKQLTSFSHQLELIESVVAKHNGKQSEVAAAKPKPQFGMTGNPAIGNAEEVWKALKALKAGQSADLCIMDDPVKEPRKATLPMRQRLTPDEFVQFYLQAAFGIALRPVPESAKPLGKAASGPRAMSKDEVIAQLKERNNFLAKELNGMTEQYLSLKEKSELFRREIRTEIQTAIAQNAEVRTKEHEAFNQEICTLRTGLLAIERVSNDPLITGLSVMALKASKVPATGS